MTTRRLECLFKPKSIALVGASSRPGSLGRAVLDNLRAGGFRGAIHLVNPRYTTLDGMPCVARISDVTPAVDLIVVAAPRDVVA